MAGPARSVSRAADLLLSVLPRAGAAPGFVGAPARPSPGVTPRRPLHHYLGCGFVRRPRGCLRLVENHAEPSESVQTAPSFSSFSLILSARGNHGQASLSPPQGAPARTQAAHPPVEPFLPVYCLGHDSCPLWCTTRDSANRHRRSSGKGSVAMLPQCWAPVGLGRNRRKRQRAARGAAPASPSPTSPGYLVTDCGADLSEDGLGCESSAVTCE